MNIEQVVSIKDSIKSIHQANKNKGFWDSERNIGEMLMAVIAEKLQVARSKPQV